MNMFPEGKYMKESTKYYKRALQALGQTEEDITIDTSVEEVRN